MNLELVTLQHFNFLVEDYEEGLQHFRTRLGAHLNYELDPSYLPRGVRAALLTIGPIIFELIAAKPGTNSGFRRLIDRIGPGYIGVEFFVTDLAAARKAIVEHGIRIKYDTGAFFVAKPDDVFGLAVECYDADWYGEELPDPTMIPVASREYWEHEHPLGITGLDSFTVGVRDRLAAAARWHELTGSPCPPADAPRTVVPAANTELRLVNAADDEDVADLVARSGERIHSVTLAVRNIEQTQRALGAAGTETFRAGEDLIVVPARANLGVRLEFSAAPATAVAGKT